VNERKLQELERRFHTYFERMPGLTYIYAPDVLAPHHGLLHVSQQFERLTGFAADVWRNDDDFISMVVHPDDRDWLRALSHQAGAAGGTWHAEYRIITKDGQERWLRDQANLVHDEEGSPLYWLGFMLDISEQKRAEAATREAVAELEAANLELERVSQAKSEFVSVISHDFRTPLTSIQGYSELIATETLSPAETRRFAATINENALLLARMIGNVLDLDRLESGQIELDLDYDTLNHLVEGVLDSFQPTLAHHQLVTRLDDDLPLLWCDPDLIVRMITNLVANAIKYSPAGGTVTVVSRRRSHGVELTVADEGLGIPEDQREAIFTRYSRVARPEQRDIDGTGLGLPIAKQIVGLHGGEIWVTANKPTGSIFHVFLPTEPPQ
jgi:PAS domain S-box-containing protein